MLIIITKLRIVCYILRDIRSHTGYVSSYIDCLKNFDETVGIMLHFGT